MSKAINSRLGPTLYMRINEVQMSEAERQAALQALQNAEIMVDAVVRVAKKIEQLGERLFLKPSLRH